MAFVTSLATHVLLAACGAIGAPSRSVRDLLRAEQDRDAVEIDIIEAHASAEVAWVPPSVAIPMPDPGRRRLAPRRRVRAAAAPPPAAAHSDPGLPDGPAPAAGDGAEDESGAGNDPGEPAVQAAAGSPDSPPLVAAAEARYLRTYETFPRLPKSLHVAGRTYAVGLRICVCPLGRVTDVQIERGAAPELGEVLASAVRTWRYRPRAVAGVPAPFCHLMRVEYTLR